MMQSSYMDHLVHLALAVFPIINTLLGAWLVHRRKVADRERRWFYRQMREKHGLIEPKLLQEQFDFKRGKEP